MNPRIPQRETDFANLDCQGAQSFVGLTRNGKIDQALDAPRSRRLIRSCLTSLPARLRARSFRNSIVRGAFEMKHRSAATATFLEECRLCGEQSRIIAESIVRAIDAQHVRPLRHRLQSSERGFAHRTGCDQLPRDRLALVDPRDANICAAQVPRSASSRYVSVSPGSVRITAGLSGIDAITMPGWVTCTRIGSDPACYSGFVLLRTTQATNRSLRPLSKIKNSSHKMFWITNIHLHN
jgi:hypothetical protein